MLAPTRSNSFVTPITSRQNALVARVRAARDGREPSGARLLEGRHLLTEALAAGLVIDLVALGPRATAGDPDRLEPLLRQAKARGAAIVEVADRVMAALSPVRQPTGIVTLARLPEGDEARLFAGPAPFVVVACGVQDPGNVGALLRVVEASGGTGVWLAGDSADPGGWKALRGAMGSAFRLPWVRVPDVERSLAACRHHRMTIVAATTDGVDMTAIDLGGRIALYVGAEGQGLPAPVVAAAHALARVPMAAPLESLNVTTAVAVLAYEARRQRLVAAPSPVASRS
jgi:TrmH family RNA methyltransferase